MRISNHFTTVLLLIICGLFLVSGTSGDSNQYDIICLSDEDIYVDLSEQIDSLLQLNTNVVTSHEQVLIGPYDGTGYFWSQDGTLLTIYGSGSYAFSNAMFSKFGIYIAAPFVTLDGRKWHDVNTPTGEQVVIAGYTYPKIKSTIGIHGQTKDLKSLNLSHVSVSISDANERAIGITGARDILDSSIQILGKKRSLIVGMKEVYGTFDRSNIDIIGDNKVTMIGIQSFYGKMSGGSIIIDAPMHCEQYEMVGILELAKSGEISGGNLKLTGYYGYANGIHVLRGRVTGGAFEVLSNEAYGIEYLFGGVVSGGTFDIQAFSFASGIWSVSSGTIDGGFFRAFALGEKGFAAGLLFCQGGNIADGVFYAENEANAVGIFSNKCIISGGELWAVSRDGYSIGIGEALRPLDGGTITAWATDKDKAIGILHPYLSDGKEEVPYSFIYGGIGFVGDATLYPMNHALVREIYNTRVTISPRPDLGAVIIPNKDKSININRHRSVPVSFDSRPGYDLINILINGEPIEIVKYIDLTTDKDYIIHAISVPNQLHVNFEADIVKGIVPLHVTFTATAENEEGDVSWFWDFGNNERGYEQVVTTTYTMPGTYAVLVTGTDNVSSATARKTAYIIVEEAF
jgi:hypothetical protein